MQLARCQQATSAGFFATADGAAPHLCLHGGDQTKERIARSFDKLAAALQTGKGTVDFLEDLRNTLQREKDNIEKHAEERAPDESLVSLDVDTAIGGTATLLEGKAHRM